MWVDAARSPSSQRGSWERCPGSPLSSCGPARPDGSASVMGFAALRDEMNPRTQRIRALSPTPAPPPHPSCPPVGWRDGPVRPSRSAGVRGLRVASEGADAGAA